VIMTIDDWLIDGFGVFCALAALYGWLTGRFKSGVQPWSTEQLNPPRTKERKD